MEIRRFDSDRQKLLPLFYLADDSKSQVAAYIGLGEVFVATEGDEILGHAQLIPTEDPTECELKSIAVRQDRRGAGVGRALMEAVITLCRVRDLRRLILSTATADTHNLRFYQRLGFRMYRIVQDAFKPSTGYPETILIDGIPLCDQVFLELKLRPQT